MYSIANIKWNIKAVLISNLLNTNNVIIYINIIPYKNKYLWSNEFYRYSFYVSSLAPRPAPAQLPDWFVHLRRIDLTLTHDPHCSFTGVFLPGYFITA